MEINCITLELNDVKSFIESVDLERMFVVKYDCEQNVSKSFKIENTGIEIECIFNLNITTDTDDKGNEVVFSFEFGIDFVASLGFFEIYRTDTTSELQYYIENLAAKLECKYLDKEA